MVIFGNLNWEFVFGIKWRQRNVRKTQSITDQSKVRISSYNQWQKLWDLPPLPLIQCWLQIGSSFLVFIATHSFFRHGTSLSQEKGGFWVTLSKSNVFLWTFLWNYSESQLFLLLIVAKLLNLGEDRNSL